MSETVQAGSNAWLDLTGRVCVVTGGGSGIGAGTVHSLAACGAAVAVLDRNGIAASAVAAEVTQSGGRAMGIEVDVSSVDGIATAAAAVLSKLGACDVLVNNAALVGYGGSLMELDLVQWNQMLNVNLTGALICARAFGAQMIATGRGGSIVNVASICGHTPLFHGGAYSVGKAGLMMLTRLLAVELGEHRIRCNSVSPGLVHTPATEVVYADSALTQARQKMVPVGRIAEPPDLANAIAFLASDRSSYVNGQDILVDGGLNQTLMSLVPKPAKPMRPAAA